MPAPDRANLACLAAALTALHARPAELGDFDASEMPMDVTNVDDLALGGNFRLDTLLGALDVMQWIAGIDADDLYAEVARLIVRGGSSPLGRTWESPGNHVVSRLSRGPVEGVAQAASVHFRSGLQVRA